MTNENRDINMTRATRDSLRITTSELQEAADQNDVVFFQSNGQARLAIAPADDSDEEILALRSNVEFMTYLADAERRAVLGPRTSLKQIRESLGT